MAARKKQAETEAVEEVKKESVKLNDDGLEPGKTLTQAEYQKAILAAKAKKAAK